MTFWSRLALVALLCAFVGPPALAARLDLSGLFGEVAREPWPKLEIPTGTGFFVDSLGHLITAAHVIAGCGQIMVTVGTGESVESGPAALVGLDARIDAALLSVPKLRPTPYLRVVPGLSGHRVTFKVPIWSVRDRAFRMLKADLLPAEKRADFDHLFQLSIELEPGASGAAVLRDDGTVAGYVVGRVANRKAVALAVPASYAQGFLRYLNVAQAGAGSVLKAKTKAKAEWQHGWAQVECR